MSAEKYPTGYKSVNKRRRMENKPEYNPQAAMETALTPRPTRCVIIKIISVSGSMQSRKEVRRNLKNIKNLRFKTDFYQSGNTADPIPAASKNPVTGLNAAQKAGIEIMLKTNL